MEFVLVGKLFCKKNNLHTRNEILQLFIQKGLINAYSKKFGQNLLHRLVLLSEDDDDKAVQAAEILLNSGISVNECDQKDFFPLRYSILKQNIPLIKFFLRKGADIDQAHNEGPPLHLAIMFCDDKNLVDFLLEQGADINNEDVEGNTALHQACRIRRKEIIRLLLKKGAFISPEKLLFSY